MAAGRRHVQPPIFSRANGGLEVTLTHTLTHTLTINVTAPGRPRQGGEDGDRERTRLASCHGANGKGP